MKIPICADKSNIVLVWQQTKRQMNFIGLDNSLYGCLSTEKLFKHIELFPHLYSIYSFFGSIKEECARMSLFWRYFKYFNFYHATDSLMFIKVEKCPITSIIVETFTRNIILNICVRLTVRGKYIECYELRLYSMDGCI